MKVTNNFDSIAYHLILEQSVFPPNFHFFMNIIFINPASGHCPPNSEISLSDFDDDFSTGNNF